MDALEAALAADLATAAGAFASPVLTWAGLAGDCALLDAAARAGLLGRVTVVFIDTLHLFPETAALLEESEKRYGFAAKRYSAVGCATKAEWNKRHASDLYMTDPEQYDQVRRRCMSAGSSDIGRRAANTRLRVSTNAHALLMRTAGQDRAAGARAAGAARRCLDQRCVRDAPCVMARCHGRLLMLICVAFPFRPPS